MGDSSGSDGGGAVGAMANQAEAQKQAQKDAAAAATRQAEMEKAIETKKYFVPIGHDSTKSGGSKGALTALVIIVLLAGAYLALDAGVIKVNSFKVPVHIVGK
jgi:hypothetical protein